MKKQTILSGLTVASVLMMGTAVQAASTTTQINNSDNAPVVIFSEHEKDHKKGEGSCSEGGCAEGKCGSEKKEDKKN